MSDPTPARIAEEAARTSYGRLLAILVAWSRDIAAAEDALADAFTTALATWPERGVPDKPEAWLLTAARRNVLHRMRHERVELDAVSELLARAHERADGPAPLVDERLQLLFVCAHPAIDESIRTPLMLQTVLGLDAQSIASAFLTAPATMGQRLVRAKTKIKQARIRFAIPEPAELPARIDDVLRSVYVAFGAGWDDLDRGRALTEEAIFLGRLLVTLMPDEPEARGLLSLMLHCEARREARRDADGRFVPLAQQDPRRWSRPLIIEAEELLTSAARAARFGRFQCEAAIQSVHAQRAITGEIRHDALRVLYDLLVERVPSVGAAVARVAAVLDAGDLDEGARAIAALPLDQVASYQPYWVTVARIAELRDNRSACRLALERALGLTEDAAVRRFLDDRLAEIR